MKKSTTEFEDDYLYYNDPIEDDKDKESKETVIIHDCGEYYDELSNLNQIEIKESPILNSLAPSATVFRHPKNKYTYIDISKTDLIWLISVITISLTCIFCAISYYLIDKRVHSYYYDIHQECRYYDSQPLATEHPDYTRQIVDIIPCAHYQYMMKWKLLNHFDTTTNYYHVVTRNGVNYQDEVSEEEYREAVRKFKHHE